MRKGKGASSKSSFLLETRLSQLEKIKNFRKTHLAPVDTCGAEAIPIGEPKVRRRMSLPEKSLISPLEKSLFSKKQTKTKNKKTKRFQTLVGLLLSSQVSVCVCVCVWEVECFFTRSVNACIKAPSTDTIKCATKKIKSTALADQGSNHGGGREKSSNKLEGRADDQKHHGN